MFPVLIALTMSAPVPPYRPKPLTISPGTYTLTWGDTHTTLILRHDGKHEYMGMWSTYRGTWVYDRKDGILSISETQDGKTWSTWHVALSPHKGDGNILSGVAKYQEREVNVTIRQKR